MKDNFEAIFLQAQQLNRHAQKIIYEQYAPRMLAIAKSYVGNSQDAEDVLLQAFYKVFCKLSDCRDANSFPFWLRKIVVNDSISFLRKNRNILYLETQFDDQIIESTPDIETELNNDINIEEILHNMPAGYRLVFNLSVFEDKKHREIAEILNISEGTSKSQLNKAKKWLLDYFQQQKEKHYAE
ncbi:RNA polymerase sigma factor [Chryseobacterium sp. T1]